MVVVRRVWDRRQCPLLQPGDAIVKINGADVQSLTFSQVKHSHQSQKPALNTYCAVTTVGFFFGPQVQRILQEHTKQGDVVLLVYRGGTTQPFAPPTPPSHF